MIPHNLKQSVKAHWEDETCGVRYGTSSDRASWFAQIEGARYALEPHILAFANFPSGRGKKVLEIGVGAGSDFCRWVKNGAHATGIDLTEAAIQLTKEHLHYYQLQTTNYKSPMRKISLFPITPSISSILGAFSITRRILRKLSARACAF